MILMGEKNKAELILYFYLENLDENILQSMSVE